MFDFMCPTCRSRQLIFPSQIRAIHNDERGIQVSFTCWCGQLARVTSGRGAVADPAQPVAV